MSTLGAAGIIVPVELYSTRRQDSSSQRCRGRYSRRADRLGAGWLLCACALWLMPAGLRGGTLPFLGRKPEQTRAEKDQQIMEERWQNLHAGTERAVARFEGAMNSTLKALSASADLAVASYQAQRQPESVVANFTTAAQKLWSVSLPSVDRFFAVIVPAALRRAKREAHCTPLSHIAYQ
eukprot:TRINITY_DN60607_c0_g1_i3.p1 TRINITY_DN60607_c0_g1~~TRINITY_DN60607_c0_g1_i3.p1  ORF type:complete len:180 (+),score=21.59 TRINITY_DN60607_c0_g1_i3:143-682(+)